MGKSSIQQSHFRTGSLRGAEARHTLLLAMAADAEKRRAQAKRIVELRLAKGRREGEFISQETAAHEIHVSARTYRTWESVGADWKLPNLRRLARYYGVTTDYIEHGVTEIKQGDTPDLSLVREAPPVTQLDRIEAALERILKAMGLSAPEEPPEGGAAPPSRLPPGPRPPGEPPIEETPPEPETGEEAGDSDIG